MNYHYFLSYRRTDKEVAMSVVAALKAKGIAVWWDQNIEGGKDWRDSIVDSLTNSDSLIILFSEDCNASKQLRKELAVADHLDKDIIPVLIEETEPKGHFLYELASRNWIQIHPDAMQKVDRLAEDLALLAEDPSSKKSAIEETTEKEKKKRKRRDFMPFRWFDVFPIGIMTLLLIKRVITREELSYYFREVFVYTKTMPFEIFLHWMILAATAYAIVVFPIRYFIRQRNLKRTCLNYIVSIGLLVGVGAPLFINTPETTPARSVKAYAGERAAEARRETQKYRILRYSTFCGGAALIALGLYIPLAGQRMLRKFRSNVRTLD